MDAIDNAMGLNQIGFAEFTASLINSTFDALISANLRQMEAYSELVKTLGLTLSEYIMNTQDSITGEEILGFLEQVLPNYTGEGSKVNVGATLEKTDVLILNKALAITGDETPTPAVTEATPITDSAFKDLLQAAARRISADKYSFLQEMVKQGMLRLVVETGVIETKMTFSTYNTASSLSESTAYNRTQTNTNNRSSRGFLQTIFGGPSKTKVATTSIQITTAKASDRSSDGTSVNIFGGVKLNFKTDYLQLGK